MRAEYTLQYPQPEPPKELVVTLTFKNQDEASELAKHLWGEYNRTTKNDHDVPASWHDLYWSIKDGSTAL